MSRCATASWSPALPVGRRCNRFRRQRGCRPAGVRRPRDRLPGVAGHEEQPGTVAQRRDGAVAVRLPRFRPPSPRNWSPGSIGTVVLRQRHSLALGAEHQRPGPLAGDASETLPGSNAITSIAHASRYRRCRSVVPVRFTTRPRRTRSTTDNRRATGHLPGDRLYRSC